MSAVALTEWVTDVSVTHSVSGNAGKVTSPINTQLCDSVDVEPLCTIATTLSVASIVDEFNRLVPEERAKELDNLWEQVRHNIYQIIQGY